MIIITDKCRCIFQGYFYFYCYPKFSDGNDGEDDVDDAGDDEIGENVCDTKNDDDDDKRLHVRVKDRKHPAYN